LTQAALRGVELVGGSLTVSAADAGHDDAGADGGGTVGLRNRFGQVCRFYVVARRAGIGDVVAGDVDRLLKCLQRRDTNSKYI
jgi:hypothetical protein